MPFGLRSGQRVRYQPATEPGEWRDGVLVRPSQNGEEWLVKNVHGQFWMPLRRIVPIDEGAAA